MKTFLSATLLLQAILSTGAAFDHSAFDSVLKQHVDRAGQVDYAGLKANRSSLDDYLAKTGAVDQSQFSGWSESEQLAFLINVYNAETLQLIIDHYPVASIKKIGGLLSSPWDKKAVVLFGSETTLDHVEHGIIRVKYPEPRIHFALVCAAKGCPPLRNEAYTAAKLEAQLESQTRTFLAESSKNRIEGNTIYLSPIFDWYGEDFETGGKTVSDYVAPYMEGGTSGKKVKFTDYDWSLNAQ